MKIIKRKNGTPISQRMVDLIAKRGVGAGRPDTPEARSTIIDQLTLQVVLSEEALKKGLSGIEGIQLRVKHRDIAID